jgi:2-C-methyl-D-erythritol 4-phosphate cytidylyltransferase / 2-C-methyl-D-erythritol 2,4-cyclodiphosphate synthase
VTISVVVVAAGSGERLGSKRPKAFVDVAGASLLEHSLTPLNAFAPNLQVVITAPEAWVSAARDLARQTLDARHDLTVVVGGSTRTESVRNALQVVSDSSELVLIHDAARAFTPVEVFERVIEALRAGQSAVIPTLDVVDTMVPRDPTTGVTGQAVDRSQLAITQTPQGFTRASLLAAYATFAGDATDDAEVIRRSGGTVVSVAGDARSFKVTYPQDLERARAMLTGTEDARIGIGVDVHRYDPEAALYLGGVHWPGEPGLAGHSDGDVVLHAICDALLQAAGLGDLGTLFGVDRPEFAGARSSVFLDHTLGLLAEAGFTIKSVTCQVIANTPRFAPRREEISQALTDRIGAPVHVAATTSDGLGLTGRGEGAAAFAVALLARHPAPPTPSK